MFSSGFAVDGSEQRLELDVDYQADMHTVTIGFTGFESSLHGISAYDWAIGTEPMGEDVQPYMEYAIRHTETYDDTLHGKFTKTDYCILCSILFYLT